MAGLGSTKNSPKWPKMAPTWSQDGAKSFQVGVKMAVLKLVGELFGAFWVVLEAIFKKMAEV